jgi:hypothetical protein
MPNVGLADVPATSTRSPTRRGEEALEAAGLRGGGVSQENVHTPNEDGRGDMSQPLIYVDTSEVRPGALEELKDAIGELADFVETNEPRLISYDVYFSDEGRRMTVIQVHPDSASLDYHMDVAGSRFGRFADLVTLTSIQIFGEPSTEAGRQLREKLQLLGSGDLTVHAPHAGFSRFGPAEPSEAAGLSE